MREKTKIGQFLYRICIERNMRLKQMAKDLNCSYVFLWMIMTNKRHLNDSMTNKIVNIYKLSEEERKEFVELSIESRTSLKFNMTQLTTDKKEIAILLNEKLSSLTKEQTNTIRKILVDAS